MKSVRFKKNNKFQTKSLDYVFTKCIQDDLKAQKSECPVSQDIYSMISGDNSKINNFSDECKVNVILCLGYDVYNLFHETDDNIVDININLIGEKCCDACSIGLSYDNKLKGHKKNN